MMRKIKYTGVLFFILPLFAHTQVQIISDTGKLKHPFFIKSKTDEIITLTPEAITKNSSFKLLDKEKTKKSGQNITLKTPRGLDVPVTFFDRKSNKAIVLGQGLNNPKEQGLYFARIFHDYDIIIFDYRWKNFLSYIFSPTTLITPMTSFVFAPQEEVITVVNYLKSLKNYDSIIGRGQCYSAFLFAMAQTLEQKNNRQLFSKLILDSCWLSLTNFLEQISLDPWLLPRSIHGGTPKFLKSILNNPIIHIPMMEIIKQITPNISIKPYLNKLHTTPILFIHGQNDFIVPYEQAFEKIWQETLFAPKAAFITPEKHVLNAKNAALYYHICNLFCAETTIENFLKKLL